MPSEETIDAWRARTDWSELAISFKTVLPIRDPVTRTVPAIFTTTTTEQIRPGDQVTFAIAAEEGKNGFWIPQTALAESDRGLWAVYAVVNDEGANNPMRIERREVELLHIDSGKVFVNGALKDGDRLVWSGIHRLVPNQQVALGNEKGLSQVDDERVVQR
jgi:multidrug efflux pump subunit AcrA (membrane-fusion protein)